MALRDWTILLTAIGHLALALSSTARAGKSPLGRPLALLAFDLFGWTFATFANHRFGGPVWRSVDVIFTALAPPLVLHFVLAFVGKRSARRPVLLGSYVLFGALAASSAPAAFTTWGAAWVESDAWAFLFLAGWLPTLLYELSLLVSHLRSGIDADEKARTRLVLAALAVGGVFASTDLLSDIGVRVPALGALGTLISTSLLAVVVLRFRLFDENLGGKTTLYAVAVAVAAVVVYLVVVQGLGGNLPAMAFGIALVTLALTSIVKEAASSLSAHRERVERLAVLGRFSAQMAHDLKNPLAALVGAVQVLEAEGQDSKGDRGAFRTMIVQQAERIRGIVETYDRLGRVEPVRSLVPLNDLVKRVTALSRYAAVGDVTVTLDLDPTLGECDLDPDLVSGALENLVRNALEAMPDGGALTVSTRGDPRADRARTLLISVHDTGEGMDARQAERAFDDFYTTKTTGSGLGLAFVRRVALAHGGDASLTSKRGAGTTVQLRLPLR